ncbi:transglutaminase domain-containing protein [Candidatus Roizmanbacteria bacterium]|nr:transglutaminase domain-containing protein [Candidatus Roizmanbacteria bacterium]
MKKLLIFLILNTLYFILYTGVYAQDFRNDFQVEYFLNENENKLNSQVKFTVTITNLRTDVYVNQFSIGFPKSFTIRDLKALDDYGVITPQITTTDSATKITLGFSNPNIGKNSVNNFYLEFYQDNLFEVNGNIWEVIIPTVEKKNGSYKILVHLPKNSNKKISISKPKPDYISGETITWNNPKTKTVYAVFGDTQYYQTELTYRIKNPKLVPVYMDVAFPPDTLYQKIYVDKIVPPPAKVFSDEDGNYLGRYFLNPAESKVILFTATISVFSKLREDLIAQIRNKFFKQKNYLLSETKYWKISRTDSIADVSTDVKDVYYFVTNKLQYDYDKVKSENIRLGADEVLKNPNRAVCMEFTDLFIALAREKGIYSREIQGYGFSQDPKLRPLSLVSDILHSWPEYYDTSSQLWLPLDPTWENTSGIDYFSSFDLNHITFAIHGKDSEYPLPAGTYKTGDSRDVSISATNKIPNERLKLSLEHPPFPRRINDSQTYQTKITLINTGNTYFWSNPIPIRSSNLEVQPSSLSFDSLAPYEKKILTLSFRAKEKNERAKGRFSIAFPQENLQAEFSIMPFYYELALKISLGTLVILSIISFIILIRKRRAK